MTVTFRFAGPEDVGLILSFIRALAAYEKMADEVVADENILREELFEKRRAEVIFPCLEGKEVGFALFFHNFSTFLGRSGLYLEDLFILPEYRGRGIGKQSLQELSRIADERGCGRLEWCCLDWNESAIGFYKRMGAVPMSEWTTYRLAGEKLKIQGAVARIRHMERVFDCLLAEKGDETQLAELMGYYQGPLWRQDYRLDEMGLLPPELKRGVLSQDGVWNYLEKRKRER